MPTILACKSCKGQFKLPDTFTGAAVKCPKCAQVVRVSRPATAGQPAPAPARPSEPIAVSCDFCGDRFKAPGNKAGQTVTCPTCESTVSVPAGSAAGGSSTTTATAPTPPPAAAPAQAAVIVVACTGCQNKLRLPDKYAGKAVKCPKCAQIVKVPAAAPGPSLPAKAVNGSASPPKAPPSVKPTAEATWGPDWIEVNEGVPATAPVAPTARAESKGAAGEWGEKLLDGHDIPDQFREDIRAELTRGERLLWADRPQVEMQLHKARTAALIGGILGAVFSLGAIGALVYFTMFQYHIAGVLVPIPFLLIGGAIAVFSLLGPGMVRRGALNRAVYMLTNRRVLIHNGTGMKIAVKGGNFASTQMQGGVGAFTAPMLFCMRRMENKKFPGSGDLKFGRSTMEEAGGAGFDDIAKVKEVEMLVRKSLIDPLIEKALRGPTGSAEKGELKKEAVDKDNNIKDAPGLSRGRNAVIEGNNIKDAKDSIEQELKSVSKELRKQVEAELTEGEKTLWISEPEAGNKGRGILGTITGAAERRELTYTLYALTNRRALVWEKKEPDSPTSYYSPYLRGLGFEKDDRVKNGGNLIFKVVKVTTKTTDKNGRTKTRVEMYYYGFMHIRNYRAVARMLYETLLAPLEG